MSESRLLGVVLLVRHGDRQGFYQSPTSYTPTGTIITPLGNQQEYQLGQLLRTKYLNESSESHIDGLNSSIVDLDQILVRADAGGEGGVIYNSAMSLVQGLFPANSNYTTRLANGTTIEGPLDGYQYVAIESVEPDNDVSLEGWTECGAFTDATTAFYNSEEFQRKANESQAFLSQLPQYLDGRPVTLENMWNIFDFMNVQNIHNADFHNNLPETLMLQARDLANYHEYGVFSSPQLDGIGNIAARTILPSLVSAMQDIANASNPLKFMYSAISYKPFLSLFNMTSVAEQNSQLTGIVNYAGAVALELWQTSDNGTASQPALRFTFKNGTDDEDFRTYNFMNESGDVPLSTFVNYLSPAMINTTADWCQACGNTEDRGCGALTLATEEGASSVHLNQKISPVGAGFLGAGLMLAVALLTLIGLAFLGCLSLGGRRSTRRRKGSDTDSTEKA